MPPRNAAATGTLNRIAVSVIVKSCTNLFEDHCNVQRFGLI